MTQRFVKLVTSETTRTLRKDHPWAFLLLTHLADHARGEWSENLNDGLLPGDCIMPGWEVLNFPSEKVYRTAKKNLIDMGLIKIVYSIHGKKEGRIKGDQRAIKRAIKSEVVNICNSDVYDLNISDKGEQKIAMRAEKGRHTRTKNEDISFKKENEEKKERPLQPAAAGSSKIVSFPSQEKMNEILEACEVYVAANELKISLKTLRVWVKKFDEHIIVQQLSNLASKKNEVGKHEAWMEISMASIQNFTLNKTFIEEFVKKNNIICIIPLKNYCRDIETGNDYAYNLPHESFKEIIYRKFNQKLEGAL